MKFTIEILKKIVLEDSFIICLTKFLRKFSGDCGNWPCVNKERLWIQNADFFLAKKINTNRNMLDIFEMKEQEIKNPMGFSLLALHTATGNFQGQNPWQSFGNQQQRHMIFLHWTHLVWLLRSQNTTLRFAWKIAMNYN